jgi:integrase/recombinase XerD
MLWESGARIGEIGDLRRKDVVFDKYGTVITVKGKTGSRKIRLIACTPHVSTWLNNHPNRNPEDPIWVSIGTVNNGKQMKYGTLRCLLKRLFARAGIRKRFNPHLFRHSRATFMARHLTEFQMNQYFGWIQGSKMAATYVHMSGRDVDNAILQMNGMAIQEKQEESVLVPKKCVRCHKLNAFDSKHCDQCGGVLDVQYAMEVEEKMEKRGKADELMNLLMKDPDVLALMSEKMYGLKIV